MILEIAICKMLICNQRLFITSIALLLLLQCNTKRKKRLIFWIPYMSWLIHYICGRLKKINKKKVFSESFIQCVQHPGVHYFIFSRTFLSKEVIRFPVVQISLDLEHGCSHGPVEAINTSGTMTKVLVTGLLLQQLKEGKHVRAYSSNKPRADYFNCLLIAVQ